MYTITPEKSPALLLRGMKLRFLKAIPQGSQQPATKPRISYYCITAELSLADHREQLKCTPVSLKVAKT